MFSTGARSLAWQILQEYPIDLLLIPPSEWNSWLKEGDPSYRMPGAVLFLLGQGAQCPFDNPAVVDFTLERPVRAAEWARIVYRYQDPVFRSRRPDFLLVSSNCRTHVIGFDELEGIVSDKGWLTVQTTRTTYGLAGRPSQFQRDCPVPLVRVARSRWVTERVWAAMHPLAASAYRRPLPQDSFLM